MAFYMNNKYTVIKCIKEQKKDYSRLFRFINALFVLSYAIEKENSK